MAQEIERKFWFRESTSRMHTPTATLFKAISAVRVDALFACVFAMKGLFND